MRIDVSELRRQHWYSSRQLSELVSAAYSVGAQVNGTEIICTTESQARNLARAWSSLTGVV